MDCRSFFQRQRAILFAPVTGSGASIGQHCTIVEIDPQSKLNSPNDATHWRVRVFLPHVPEYREVFACDLIGLQERDDSPLPAPNECWPHVPRAAVCKSLPKNTGKPQSSVVVAGAWQAYRELLREISRWCKGMLRISPSSERTEERD